MSFELSASKLEVRDNATNALVLNHVTKLIPIVQKVTLTNIDVVFPDVSKATQAIMNTGTTGGTPNRGWRAYSWGLRIDAGIQQGSINLATITPGTSPNLILGNIRTFRLVNPREDVFGPFIKSILENTWLPVRSGARLEYSAWCRRIVWFDIAGGFLRLNWKQSTRSYSPNQLDPNIVFFPDLYLKLQRPPAYQIGSKYYTNPGGITDPPINFPPTPTAAPSWTAGPLGNFSFGSTWRFSNINLWLGQL